MSTIKDRIIDFVAGSDECGFLRSEFNRFGSRAGVSKALRDLVREGNLLKLGYGIYVPARDGRYAVREADAVLDSLRKLGADPEWGGRAWREYVEGKTTQVPVRPTVTVRKRVTRRIGRGNKRYRYEYDIGRRS